METTDRTVLDDRERAALTAIAIGLPQEQAARRVGLSTRTFRRVLAGAAEKLGATETIHAVALAAATGQIDHAHIQARTSPLYPAPIPKDVRAWAAERGVHCPPRGPIPCDLRSQYEADVLSSRRHRAKAHR
ncbi:antitoxin Xre-like helix-turn-helix domain-containing protein [Actinomadura sp. 3N508]|uniref:Lsr2 family DNA-binding protein n=1 Tax=Actinomadura sp. 3N508 TaxID=3375153 RepID=UPI0037A0F581